MIEWMLVHPYLALFGWCWAWFWFWFGVPPLVSVRPYTSREQERRGL